MATVLLIEDHALVRSGIRSLLERAGGLVVVGEAADGREGVRLKRDLAPDIAVVDVGMPNLNGIEAMRQMRAESPATRVLMLSMHADREYVYQALSAGAAGYVLKSAAFGELLSAIQTVLAGRRYLSPPLAEALKETPGAAGGQAVVAPAKLSAREREILQLVAEGNSGPIIAGMLGISERTVETNRLNIMNKLNIHTIAGLTRFAIQHGMCFLEH